MTRDLGYGVTAERDWDIVYLSIASGRRIYLIPEVWQALVAFMAEPIEAPEPLSAADRYDAALPAKREQVLQDLADLVLATATIETPPELVAAAHAVEKTGGPDPAQTEDARAWRVAKLCGDSADRYVRQAVRLRHALTESVKLQAHYAELLNLHDGGQRVIFQSADDWLARLDELATVPPGPTGEWCPHCGLTGEHRPGCEYAKYAAKTPEPPPDSEPDDVRADRRPLWSDTPVNESVMLSRIYRILNEGLGD